MYIQACLRSARVQCVCLTVWSATEEQLGSVPSRVAAAATSHSLLRPPGDRADLINGGDVKARKAWFAGAWSLHRYITRGDGIKVGGVSTVG